MHLTQPSWPQFSEGRDLCAQRLCQFQAVSLLGVQPVILAYRPPTCPQCGKGFEEVQIEYLLNDGGRLLMVRDLPVLRCQGDKHLFVLEETIDRLEQLMTLEGRNQIKPVSSLTIPVYEFAAE